MEHEAKDQHFNFYIYKDGPDRKRQRSFLRHVLLTVLMLSAAFFLGSAFVITGCKETQCEPRGSETLPKGIVSRTSDLVMRSLSGPGNKKTSKKSMSLLAIAAGIKQKESVNKIVKKFPSTDFMVMLFHYDGIVDDWRDLEWSAHAIHISAVNQTKWWFAKRFLHPDIVSDYAYIFLWDEDLGVDNFDARRYISTVKEEGLEISQPALDPDKSEVHHHVTARNNGTRVHRKIHMLNNGGRMCDLNSANPPCAGFVEMMAPVFSIASWRCVWHMIQNDLVHAWGVDFQLGYCAQGDPTKNIGIVDAEYIVHYGLPTLGGLVEKKAQSLSHQPTARDQVRNRSYVELEIFKNRWRRAVKNDDCWVDLFEKSQKLKKH
ncbi:Lysine ketoglutarate reductase trans-splicing-like protein, putative (DUF707) [Melia azedarach]|uniref:Lysine ketoglutarate reductase trans-splicing-like protein, putative (DUF707) n=1 Tax=Melia azedarach TaxID=155640 RepID=A0ACC1Z4A1_MELAZ|nr:Lysine ketoglutarate reductase trans-splicing-like protein, putative (DUF707) [Melia azedarach]